VDFYGNYSFHYFRQKRFHLWSYSHHPSYLLVGALSIKQDLQTRPSSWIRELRIYLDEGKVRESHKPPQSKAKPTTFSANFSFFNSIELAVAAAFMVFVFICQVAAYPAA